MVRSVGNLQQNDSDTDKSDFKLFLLKGFYKLLKSCIDYRENFHFYVDCKTM